MKSKLAIVLCVLTCGLVPHAPHARAQSFRLNTFRGAERADDGFGVRRLGAFDHLSWGGLLSADYAHDALVLEGTRSAGAELATVVRHQLTLKLDLSLALWNRLILFVGADVQPVVKGPNVPASLDVPAADGGGMGDLSLGARVRLLGERGDLFALGAQATLITPTAGSQSYRGEEGVALRPELIAELRPRFVRISANLGTLVRQQQSLLSTDVASQLLYGLAAALPLLGNYKPHETNLEIIGELWGGLTYQDFAGKNSSPVDWLLGAKYASARGWFGGLAAGRGLSHGIGSPDARIIAQVGYLRPPKAVPPPAPPLPAPPPPAPTEPGDRDGDTVLDAQDGCPDQPEDHDDFEDADGCAEPDNDADGVLDVDDACRELPGKLEERGCPGKVKLTEEGELVVFQQILFEFNQAVVLGESLPNLEAVQKLLQEHPQLTRVRIEGHTDSVGQDAINLTLSQQRAAAVGSWLVQHGIDRSRLEAYGCGELHPLTSEATPEGLARNRRVMFQVIEPVPAEQSRAAPPAGCVSAPIE